MLDNNIFEKLKLSLNKSWLKKDKTKFNSSSVAITNKDSYYSGLIESKTHLLDISSEQGSLVLAVSNNDANVKEIVTLIDGNFLLNPLVIKFIIDHIVRTNIDIKYSIYDLNKNKVFSTNSVYNFLDFYKPEFLNLENLQNRKKRDSITKFNKYQSLKEQLYHYAKEGSNSHYYSSNSKTCYGASVITKNNNIYFTGVYSSFDKRLSLHAEMSACLNAIMNNDRNIIAVGLVSNKFVNDFPQACGCCRQFLMEIMQKTSIPIKIYCFTYDNNKCFEINLENYLPFNWESIRK